VRRSAATALGAFPGDAARAALLPLLGDPDPSVRCRAGVSLARCGVHPARPSLVPFVVGALREGDPAVRLAAAAVLGQWAEECPTPALASAIPHLRRLAGVWRPVWSPDPETALRAFREALHRIEQATRATRDLPLPATVQDDLADLPRPASPPDASPGSLPLPAAPEEA
jgi:HEAT repeat protein